MTNRKKKRPLSPKRTQGGLILGITWYTPEQFKRMKAVADDAEALDDTYKDWLKNATGHLRRLKKDGFQVVKTPIDVEEWVAWCKNNGKALDGAARSEYTSEKASGRFGESS